MAGMRNVLAGACLLLLAAPAAAQVPDLPPAPLPATYPSYATLTKDLQDLAAAHPDIARLDSLGASGQGLQLWALTITNLSDPRSDAWPTVLVDGGLHGDEPLGVALALALAHDLVEGYGRDAPTRAIVDGHRIVVAPLLNPDGHTLRQRGNAAGVDLDRNFPFQWQPGPAAGPEPGSEPETRAVMKALAELRPATSLSLRSGEPALLRPFAHAPDEPAPDEAVYEAAAALAPGFPPARTASVGNRIDWAYATQAAFSLGLAIDDGGLPPLAPEDLARRLAGPLEVVRGLVAQAERWGGRLEARVFAEAYEAEATLEVRNVGAGWARGIGLAATGLRVLDALPSELAPGAVARVRALVEPPSEVALRYQPLAIQAEDATATAALADASLLLSATEVEPHATPGLEGVALWAGLCAAALLARRARSPR